MTAGRLLGRETLVARLPNAQGGGGNAAERGNSANFVEVHEECTRKLIH